MRHDPQTRRSPGGTGLGVVQHEVRGGQRDSTPARALSESEFLAHFDDVRPAGPDSWTAKAHPGQRSGSVAISRLADGKWLVHDFAGTPTVQLLADRGLSLGDLFPTRQPGRRLSLPERLEVAERSRLARWRAAWNAVCREVALVEVAARELAGGQVLDAAEVERIAEAAQRIADARVALAEVEQHGTARRLGPRPGRFFADLGADHLAPEITRKEGAQ